jgi:hypothetical protein
MISFHRGSHYKACKINEKKEGLVRPSSLVPVVPAVVRSVATVVSTHFTDENPDEPDSTGQTYKDEVEDEIPESIFLHDMCFLSFWGFSL